MPSVTINEKGIVSQSGSGFAVNDGPMTPHAETLTDSASLVLKCIPHDNNDGTLVEGDSGFEVSLNGTVDDGEEAGTFIGLYVAFKDGAGDDYYIWFNIDPANGVADVTTDPGTTGDATGTGFEVKAAAEDANTPDKIAGLVATAVDSAFTPTASVDGSGNVTLLSLSMGKLAGLEQSVGDLIGLGDGEESFAFDVTQPTAPSLHGDFPAVRGELRGHGVSHLGSTGANALTVVLPDGSGAGVKKILRGTNVAAGTVTVSCTARHTGTRASNASTIAFNAAADTAVLMWNSSDELWEVVSLTGVVMAN